MRLAVVASHPVQYYAPLYREIARELDLTVFYAHRDTEADQARAGFGQGFAWDVDLLSGYRHHFLANVARQPGLGRFAGVDTPGIKAELQRGRFDAVLVMGWFLKCFLQALYAAKRLRIPVLVRGDSQLDTPRSPLKRFAKELVYPPFLRLFDGALVVGQRNQAYWEHYRYPRSRMFASPHCVDAQWFASRATPQARERLRNRLGISPDAPIALFAGKLLPFKRPLDLITAAASARASGFPLEVMVAGSGPLEAELTALAAAARVPLHMLGFCNQTEMPEAYAASDVLVLPSTARETWGLVVNEAIACGLRAIVSDAVGCASDMTRDRSVAMSYPLGDAQALGRTLVAVLSKPADPGALADRSRAHSLQTAAHGVLEAMHALAQPQRPKACSAG